MNDSLQEKIKKICRLIMERKKLLEELNFLNSYQENVKTKKEKNNKKDEQRNKGI